VYEEISIGVSSPANRDKGLRLSTIRIRHFDRPQRKAAASLQHIPSYNTESIRQYAQETLGFHKEAQQYARPSDRKFFLASLADCHTGQDPTEKAIPNGDSPEASVARGVVSFMRSTSILGYSDTFYSAFFANPADPTTPYVPQSSTGASPPDSSPPVQQTYGHRRARKSYIYLLSLIMPNQVLPPRPRQRWK